MSLSYVLLTVFLCEFVVVRISYHLLIAFIVAYYIIMIAFRCCMLMLVYFSFLNSRVYLLCYVYPSHTYLAIVTLYSEVMYMFGAT